MIAIDSEFQSLIPPLSEDEYERLEKSILAEGVRDPIITWNGTIVDGHNRYHICDEHGITCPQKEREFDSREAAKIWIIENQFGRRNLSKYDRSVLALQLEPLYAAEAKRRMSDGGGSGDSGRQKSDNPSRTDEQLAKLAGTSRDTIRKVKVIEQEAAKGNETAVAARDAVKSGEKSINKAYGEIRPRICTVCGEPIKDGDAYDRDINKHKACANKTHDLYRTRNANKFTEDGRRVCTVCGEPIDEGEHYQDKLNMHYKCGLAHYIEVQRKYRDADRDLRENVPTYTIDSLLGELTASAKSMQSAMEESIAINESMGVQLTKAQRKRLDRAILQVHKTIQRIKEETSNG